jgi:hypothetical protein
VTEPGKKSRSRRSEKEPTSTFMSRSDTTKKRFGPENNKKILKIKKNKKK